MASPDVFTAPDSSLLRNVQARGYQTEMFERSMKGNIIVAMDTGGGKTYIAVLRILAELERCQAGPGAKRIWFLAPTVDLCKQQHGYISSQMPYVNMRTLLGDDGVDRWTTQSTWDDVLRDMKIVVSTHAVLADALSHGFVQMSQLALLIFDEAHHCSRNHPANRIMKHFYFPLKERLGESAVPHILGLSASPIARSKISELEKIESSLDAISVTPRINRQELFKYVHRPKLHIVLYPTYETNSYELLCPVLFELHKKCLQRNILLGPVYPEPTLLGTPTKKRKHNVLDVQLQKFCNKAIHIFEELGPWASSYFILESVNVLARRQSVELDIVEREALLQILDDGLLHQLRQTKYAETPIAVSAKVEKLLSFLNGKDPEKCSSLLFVKQRVTVSVLHKLLSLHPRVKDRFDCATFVGTSNNAARKFSMTELLDLKAQRETLSEFRAKTKNLIIATDVLEEGIDVRACNMVICFDPPANVKSFIQRRGRARQEISDYAIMFSEREGSKSIQKWKLLEEELIRTYQDEQREIQDLRRLEDETVEVVPGKLVVESTGACIMPDSAISHLYHFCAILPPEPYVDLIPRFTYQDDPDTKLITATVTLPNTIVSSVRVAHSLGAWRTESAATKDACFQAYSALYKAGLLNDNLLPLSRDWIPSELELEDTTKLASEIQAQPAYSPWYEKTGAWLHGRLYQTKIVLQYKNKNLQQMKREPFDMYITTPWPLPEMPCLDLALHQDTKVRLEFGPSMEKDIEALAIKELRRSTQLLVNSLRASSTVATESDYVALFSTATDVKEISAWCNDSEGNNPAASFYLDRTRPAGLIRYNRMVGDYYRTSKPQLFHDWTATGKIQCRNPPRRQNFISKSTKSFGKSTTAIQEPVITSLPLEDCTVDRLDETYAQFSLLLQPILRHIEVYKIVERFYSTVLKDVPMQVPELVASALTTANAGLATDYQRLEFVGDAVLKFIVSLQVYCEQENWHQGYLTRHKEHVVSNQALAKMAVKTHLSAFVISGSERFKRWKIPTILDMQSPTSRSSEERKLSMKQHADIVEALIGAAYSEGGLALARACANVFQPKISLSAPTAAHHAHPTVIESDVILSAEKTIGYTFKSRHLLLQALTHQSYVATSGESYERLEFLGDAVLDILMLNSIMAQSHVALSPGQMTRMRAALASGRFLGFLCLDYNAPDSNWANTAGDVQDSQRPTRLWKFLRHCSPDLATNLAKTNERYQEYGEQIRQSLRSGSSFPWTLLHKLAPDKFLSDMIESVVAAIYLDSGDLPACQDFITRIGLTAYLHRLFKEDVMLLEPTAIYNLVKQRKEHTWTDSSHVEGDGRTLYSCVLKRDDEVLASATSYESVQDARYIVAASAYEASRVMSLSREESSIDGDITSEEVADPDAENVEKLSSSAGSLSEELE